MEFDSFALAASCSDLADEPRAREHADCLEFRMDLADDPLSALDAYDGELPILATNRAPREGGASRRPADRSSGRRPREEGRPDERERLERLRAATAVDAVAAVDVELATIRAGRADDLLETARRRGVAVVASAHDFEGTPPVDAMRRTLRRACDRGDVGKLAVTADSLEDALAVLSITRECSAAGRAVATMAMGERGRHTRALAPVYGSRIGYAPVDPDRATAPGQYDLETLSRLVAALE